MNVRKEDIINLKREFEGKICKLKTKEVSILPSNPCLGESVILGGEIYFYVGGGNWVSISGGISNEIHIVENYSALPDPTTVSGEFYYALNSQGTKWLPGSWGGTYYNSGLYYSNGVSWKYSETPFQATQIEVNTGINDFKFVTPYTLANSTQWDTKNQSLQFQDEGSDLGTSGTVNELDFVGDNITATRIGNKVTVNVSGGTGSGEAVIKEFIAGEIINGGKAVIVDIDEKIYIMDITDTDHWYKFLGIAANSAIIDDPVNVVINGVTEVLGSGWLAGQGYYISSSGFLTTIPPTNGMCKQIAVGISNEKISINHYSEFVTI